MTTNHKLPAADYQLLAVEEMLQRYRADFPEAKTRSIRTNEVSIRVQIVDPRFNELPFYDRQDAVWDSYIATMPESTQLMLSMLMLISPNEVRTIGREFEPAKVRTNE